MNSLQLFEVLVGRFKVILAVTLLLTVGMFIFVSAMPKKYTASAQILVDARSADVLSATQTERSQTANQVMMATQAALIGSDRVARRVVSTLKLDASTALRRQWREETGGTGDLTSYVARDLLKRLDVRPGHDSNVITVSFMSGNPKFATEVVNAFGQASIDTNLELKVEPARLFSSWFNARTDTLRKELEEAQRKLTAYQRQKGLLSAAPGQIDIENAKLAQLAAQLVEMQANQSESNSRQKQARGDAATSPDVMNNAVISGLRTDIATQEGQLKQLGSQYGDQHPLVIAARERLAELRKQQQSEMQSVARSVSTANSVNEQRVAETRAALDAQRARVFALMHGSDEMALLQRGVESAQRAFDAASTRQSQTSLESQVQQTNVYLLAPATEPFLPSGPKVLLFTACAAALGLLLGIALALWRESRNPLIRSREDLALVVDLPLLAALPRTVLGRGRPRARRLLQGLLSGVRGPARTARWT